jgi:hypothetical protein
MKRRNSLLALCAVIAGSILGVVLAQSIPSAVFPQIQFNRAIILADSGDLPSVKCWWPLLGRSKKPPMAPWT